jgi:hypothetical protein
LRAGSAATRGALFSELCRLDAKGA